MKVSTMKLPEGFVDLSTAYNAAEESFHNIIGVVVDLMAPAITRTGEHMMTFKLLDERLRDSLYGSKGLPVRFFRRDIQSLPRISQHGDVVLIRNVKMRAQNGQPMALSNHQTSPLVFPGASIPEPTYQISFQDKRRIECLGVPQDKEKFSLEEQKYIIHLKHALGTANYSSFTLPPGIPTGPAAMTKQPGGDFALQPGVPTGPAAMTKRPGGDLVPPDPKKQRQSTSSTFGRKFRLVKELRHLEFADICGQVVKKFSTKFGACELYITDYTENKDMFFYAPPEAASEGERDGDDYGYSGPPKKTWPGPYGWLVLKVNVKDPHAYYANREVNDGDFVLLRNVKMKIMAQGSRLEGDMWPDMDNPEKVQIIKQKNHEVPEMKALEERKRRYWESRASKAAAKEQQAEKKQPTRTELKKQKKQLKAQKKAGEPKADVEFTRQGASDQNEPMRSKADINQYVRCGHDEVPISTVRYILDPENDRHVNALPDGKSYILPFVNARYRARVRVIDFAPRQLEDFSVPEMLHDGEKSENGDLMDWESSARYEWTFSLLLEDANKAKGDDKSTETIWVNLGHEEAQYLFGRNLNDPTDLRTDHQLLARLREQLCILWGNVAERTDDQTLSNRPFDCCLMEHGVEMDDDDPAKASHPFGVSRQYRMFGVTIL